MLPSFWPITKFLADNKRPVVAHSLKANIPERATSEWQMTWQWNWQPPQNRSQPQLLGVHHHSSRQSVGPTATVDLSVGDPRMYYGVDDDMVLCLVMFAISAF